MKNSEWQRSNHSLQMGREGKFDSFFSSSYKSTECPYRADIRDATVGPVRLSSRRQG